MNEFFTWDVLTSFGGMALAVSLIVQFTKGFVKGECTPDWAVRLYAWVISVALQTVVIIVNAVYTPEIVTLAIVNSVLITLIAIGGYEVIADTKNLQ